MIFYFDENIPPQIARAINLLDKNNEIYTVKDKYQGLKDLELIPKLAEEKAVLITFDKNMRKNRAERTALEQNKMIVFFFATQIKDYWDFVKLNIKIWKKITELVKKTKEKPKFYRVTGQGKIE